MNSFIITPELVKILQQHVGTSVIIIDDEVIPLTVLGTDYSIIKHVHETNKENPIQTSIPVALLSVKEQRKRKLLEFYYTAENEAFDLVKDDGNSGFDLACLYDVKIAPFEKLKIKTGIRIELPKGYGGFVFERSSTNLKWNVSLTNKVGVIDNIYRGELLLSVKNESVDVQYIPKGTRLAQLVILEVKNFKGTKKDILSETTRGDKGFGASGN